MASIKMGLAVADIRGSIAGTTFSHGTYGMYVRRKATPVNTNRQTQSQRRAKFAELASAWRSLTADQRKTFIFQAPNYSRANAFGDNVPLTGQSLYMRANSVIYNAGGSPISSAIPPQGVTSIVFENLEIDATGGTIEITQLQNMPARTAAMVYITDAVGNGLTFVSKDRFRLATSIAPAATSGQVVLTGDVQRLFGRAVAGFSATTPMYAFIRFVNVDTGEYSDSEVIKSVYTP